MTPLSFPQTQQAHPGGALSPQAAPSAWDTVPPNRYLAKAKGTKVMAMRRKDSGMASHPATHTNGVPAQIHVAIESLKNVVHSQDPYPPGTLVKNSDQLLCGRRSLDWTSQWDFYSCRIWFFFCHTSLVKPLNFLGKHRKKPPLLSPPLLSTSGHQLFL